MVQVLSRSFFWGAGGLLMLLGLALLVLPGPGIPCMILGLSLLAREWGWAHRQMERLKAFALSLKNRPNQVRVEERSF